MGWWSTDIMGGDTPLDYEDEFFDICEVEKFPEGGGTASLTKGDLESKLSDILRFLNENQWGESNIGFQVLAVLMMKAGAEMSMPVKVRMLEAISSDEWAQENDERAIVINGLYEALKVYDGKTPIYIKSRGLFEVMFGKLGGQN
jgi:hypothetical protein